jgi:hypothetical protein
MKPMMSIVIHLKLEDCRKWRLVFDQLASARKDMGSLGGELLRNSADPYDVFILWKWDSLKGAQEYFNMADWRDLMRSSGAKEPLDVHMYDIVETIQS